MLASGNFPIPANPRIAIPPNPKITIPTPGAQGLAPELLTRPNPAPKTIIVNGHDTGIPDTPANAQGLVQGAIAVKKAMPSAAPVVTKPRATAPAAKAVPASNTAPANPYAGGVPASTQTPKQLLAQLQGLVKQLGGSGSQVPPALALTHIASLIRALPTSAKVPAQASLAAIQAALHPNANTPGYVDPKAAADAAAQTGYGAAISSDNQNINQQTAQNTQNLSDIQNWYNSLLGMEKTNAASDASGYQTAIQGTGNLGSVGTALGFDAGSAGADTIGQTGSILNAAARMAAASGAQSNSNLQASSALGGIQDYKNETNRGNTVLAQLRDTLNSDEKSKGAAYTQALDAAQQANTGNANNYASALSGVNQAYQSAFQNKVSNTRDNISQLVGLNSAFQNNKNNDFKNSLSALNTAEGIQLLPGQQAAAGATANYNQAHAYEQYQAGQAAIIKANAAAAAARLKSEGVNPLGNTPAAAQARYSLAGNIFKTITSDPNVFKKDPLTGAVTLKSKKLAMSDVGRMLAIAGINPGSGQGQALDSILASMITGTA